MQAVFVNKCKPCEIRNQMFFSVMCSVLQFRSPHSTDNPLMAIPPFHIFSKPPPPPPPPPPLLSWQDSQQYPHIEISNTKINSCGKVFLHFWRMKKQRNILLKKKQHFYK